MNTILESKNINSYINYFMSKTIDEAQKNPIAPFASIIVYNNEEIVCSSVNQSHNNPIMHGELSAINTFYNAGLQLDHSKLSLYTTAEPCPMCAAAIYWSLIPNVIYGSSIPFLHKLFGRQIGIRAAEIFKETPSFYHCNLIAGVLENECNHLFINAKKLRNSEFNK